MFKLFSLIFLALFSLTSCTNFMKNKVGETELAQIGANFTSGSAGQLVSDLAQTVNKLQKFDGAVTDHKDLMTIKSLAEAFKSASELGESLKASHQSLAQALPAGSKKQEELAQSESMVGIVSILKEAYGLIRQIK